MSPYNEELNTAVEIARKAAKVIREFETRKGFNINYKGKNDLVTDADVETEQVILDEIASNFPDDHILAEETESDLRMPAGRSWLIDPIDGTTNFAHGFPVYCVSIALWENNEPKMGVVYEVNRDELFSAVKGEGAYLNGSPIQVSSINDPAEAMIGTGFPYNDLSLVDNYLNIFHWLMHHTQGIRRPGAASYDLCCVASGRFDGFYEYSLNPWDVAAAAFIVREAGGKLSDWEGGENWLFGQRIVAGNADIYAFLLEAIQNHFDEEERKAVTG